MCFVCLVCVCVHHISFDHFVGRHNAVVLADHFLNLSLEPLALINVVSVKPAYFERGTPENNVASITA